MLAKLRPYANAFAVERNRGEYASYLEGSTTCSGVRIRVVL